MSKLVKESGLKPFAERLEGSSPSVGIMDDYGNPPVPELPWDNHNSDPIADIQNFFKRDKKNMWISEKWICKSCAWYATLSYNADKTYIALVCPECGGREFHYTQNEGPPPGVKDGPSVSPRWP